jgi:RNA polymerase sigma-70 factor (ECF subfamily)
VRSVELTDAELIGHCRSGDAAAWNELVERFSRYVWAIAVQAYRLSESDAEDVFQEVFARAYQHLGRLRQDDAFRPWIGQLTRRLAIDRLRMAGREQVMDELPEASEGDGALERLVDAMDVRAALGRLPEHCREILDRFFARDQSYETIASELDIPPGTIASRISRCLGRLRAALEDREAVGAP